MIANNQKQVFGGWIADLDGNSLYPSAQARCYYPIGLSKAMTPEMISYYNTKKEIQLQSSPQTFSEYTESRRQRYPNLFKITEERLSKDDI